MPSIESTGGIEYIVRFDDISRITEEKIKSFAELPSDWFYGVETPGYTPEVINSLICINKEAIRKGFYETDAFPGTNGELMITVCHDTHYLEFIVEADVSISYYHEVENTVIDTQEDMTIDQALIHLDELRKATWNLSEYSTDNIIIEEESVLQASHSAILDQLTQGSQSSIVNALTDQEGVSASILERITKQLQVNPLSIGSSPTRSCQIATA